MLLLLELCIILFDHRLPFRADGIFELKALFFFFLDDLRIFEGSRVFMIFLIAQINTITIAMKVIVVHEGSITVVLCLKGALLVLSSAHKSNTFLFFFNTLRHHLDVFRV